MPQRPKHARSADILSQMVALKTQSGGQNRLPVPMMGPLSHKASQHQLAQGSYYTSKVPLRCCTPGRLLHQT